MEFFGHGTAQENPEDFFSRGLEMFNGEKGGYGDLSSMVLNLDIEDAQATRAMLGEWPHHGMRNILLLAVSAPGEDLDDSQRRFYLDGLVQDSGRTKEFIGGEEEVPHVPSEWILGMYNADSGMVTLNLAFTGRRLTPEDFEKSLGDGYTYSQVGRIGLTGGGLGEGVVERIPEQVTVPDKDAPFVW